MLNHKTTLKSPDDFPHAHPYDEHNQYLMEIVHPFDWVNPEPEGRYNMVVVGAGTAGLVTAAGTAGLGGKVALVERELMGGDMISEITLAMVAGTGLGTIAKTIHPYPTQAEALKKAGDAYNRTRLTPRVQNIFKTLLKWRR